MTLACVEWEEAKLIGFFEALPRREEIECGPGPQLTFDVSRDGLRVVLEISPLMSDLRFAIYVGEAKIPVFEAVYLGSPGFRVVAWHGADVIEIGAPGSFKGKYDGTQPFANGIRVHKEPAFSVQVFVT